MKTIEGYLQWLKEKLSPLYTPPATPGGYDLNHIYEMLKLGPKIAAIPQYSDLDLDEFAVAVWLHNSDRPRELQENLGIPKDGWKERWGVYLFEILADSPFTAEVRMRIIDAVLQHSKKNDEPGDSTLLTALRIADKVVRFGPLGMMGQPANRGRTQMFYDPENPFKYPSTEESQLKVVMHDYFRVLEWYAMLPCDEARALVSTQYLRAQIRYLRVLGLQISEYTGKENQIESCIKQALSAHYSNIATFP